MYVFIKYVYRISFSVPYSIENENTYHGHNLGGMKNQNMFIS